DGASEDILYESAQPEGVITVELTKGIKDIDVLRVDDQAGTTGEINPARARSLTLPIVVKYQAHLSIPETASAASTIRVNWEGPDQKSDYLATIQPGAGGSDEITYAYTKDGSPLELKLPAEPGDYEVVYVQHNGRKVLARQGITTTPVSASLEFPEQADAADFIRINWQGPDYPSDYIATIQAGAGGS